MHRFPAAVCGLFIFAAACSAQDELRFRWQKGQILPYSVDHVTRVKENAGGKQVESVSKLKLMKRWQVTAVDAYGVATLQLSLASMRHEQTRPNGEVLLFDSESPDKSTPELREQMKKYVGSALAEIRVDGQGRVLEAIKGTAAKYESEPPFIVLLPGKSPLPGQGWKRNYQVKLDPPHGTGEKYEASQTYQLSKLENGEATIRFITEFAALPPGVNEKLPLLQRQPEGVVTFYVETGRLQRAQVQTDRTLQNHRGEGSSYQFISTYDERYVGQ